MECGDPFRPAPELRLHYGLKHNTRFRIFAPAFFTVENKE
jgi:hypothetical protein